MKPTKLPLMAVGIVSVLSLLTLNLVGCANTTAQVISLASRDVTALNADDIVCVMQRAGFSDEQIIDVGTELRNTLASSGAAKIMVGNKVEVIIVVDGDYLHVASRRRGSFIYDLKKRRFR